MDQSAPQPATPEVPVPPTPMPQVPQMPPTPVVMPSPSGSKMPYILLVIVLVLVFSGVSYYLGTKTAGLLPMGYQRPTEQTKMAYPTQQVLPSATPTPDPTASWQVFTNAKFGYTIKYPTGLVPNEQNTYYHYVEFKAQNATGQLPTYVVSAIPATFTAANPAAYNYMSADWISSISAVPVGQTKTMDQAAMFTRLPDMTVDGQSAVAIEVVATGYKQQRVYIKANGNIYMISNYFQTPAELTDFQLFLSTFKLTQ